MIDYENQTITKKAYEELPFYDENKMNEWSVGDIFKITDTIKPSDKTVFVIEVKEILPRSDGGETVRLLKKELEVI